MIRTNLACLALAACLTALAFPGNVRASLPFPAAGPIRVAITIDDLPWNGGLPAEGTANDALLRMAAVLRAHDAPATGFVICNHELENPGPVETWVAWGNTIGNHTGSHRDLNRVPASEWIDDARRCHRHLEEKYGEAYLPYLRFPLLHQGDSPGKRDEVRKALDGLGLGTAHVSVDTSEWILARAHGAANRNGDAKLRREVGEAFIRHIVDAIEHADRVAQRKTGGLVPQVLLLHANSLVDDYLDELLLTLRSRGVEFISLQEALEHPVYAKEDAYVGPKGLSWLYRMAPLSLDDVAWDDAQATRIEARFASALQDDGGARPRTTISHAEIDPSLGPGLRAMLERAGASERLRSILVAQHGKIVAEAYFNGAGPETPANLKSVTKTITSALIGIALRQHWIDDLDDPIGKYLPNVASQHPDKAGITIRQLLTMSSGLEAVDYGFLQQTDNWVEAILDAPLDEDRIGTFSYDTPALQLLTAVLENASGRSSEDIAAEFLFGRERGIAYWRTDPQGIAFGGNDAYLLPKDMLRFGQMFLDGGRMEGRQVLSPEFVAESTSFQLATGADSINHGTLRVTGYGYLWWLLEIAGQPVYAALGHGGQMILVSPQQEQVVVVTSRWPGPSSVPYYRDITEVVESLFKEPTP